MTAAEAKTTLVRAAKRSWPNAAKTSDLPFLDYWKKQAEWLAFHAPHIGDVLLKDYVKMMLAEAKAAERQRRAPRPWIVPDEVKAIWRKVEAEKEPVTPMEAKEAKTSTEASPPSPQPRLRQGRLL